MDLQLLLRRNRFFFFWEERAEEYRLNESYNQFVFWQLRGWNGFHTER